MIAQAAFTAEDEDVAGVQGKRLCRTCAGHATQLEDGVIAERERDDGPGKVGLVVKMGPTAFDDPESKWFQGVNISLHDWIVFRPAEGWQLTVNNVLCRIVDDVNVRGTIPHPDMIW